jgi:hypothetical protein
MAQITATLTIRVPSDMYDGMKWAAKCRNISLNAAGVEAIRAYLDQHEAQIVGDALEEEGQRLLAEESTMPRKIKTELGTYLVYQKDNYWLYEPESGENPLEEMSHRYATEQEAIDAAIAEANQLQWENEQNR